jgi:hypothetical protein
MSTRAGARTPLADGVIAAALVLVFGAALLAAWDYSLRAGLVPRIVSAMGLAFCAVVLVRWLIGLVRPGAPAVSAPSDAPLVDAGDEDGTSVDYVFATASARTWVAALLWFGGFFVALWVLGAVVAGPLFAVAYLVLVGRARIVSAVVYGAALWALLFVLFGRVLELSLPPGLW